MTNTNCEYNLTFISECDFENHVLETVASYDKVLQSINLEAFNKNVIDPIKLTFDQKVCRKTWEEVIQAELIRQRDKSDSNAIGYFHQNMFKYIDGCVVPRQGFDVIYTNPTTDNRIYVEMKNKHNTMNSSSSAKTYMRFQHQLLNDNNSSCYLVEVLAPSSRDIPWVVTLDGIRQTENPRLRRVSIDKFYSIVTGIDNAFFQICCQLPVTLDKLLSANRIRRKEPDTVISELTEGNPDLMKALYLLAFRTYNGFNEYI